MRELEFKIEEIAACLSAPKLTVSDDLITETLKYNLVSFIYERTIDERKIEYVLDKPSFFDWLFRRKKTVVIDFKAKDLLLNPPSERTIRIYELGNPKLK